MSKKKDKAKTKTSQAQPKPLRVTDSAVASAAWGHRPELARHFGDPARTFAPGKPVPGSQPPGARMAMDEAPQITVVPDVYSSGSGLYEGLGFLGYPYLSELSQRPEYRRPVEMIALHMTRRWGKITASGDEDKTEIVAKIEVEMDRLKVKDRFGKAAEKEGFFGKGHIFLDMGDDTESKDGKDELKTPLTVTNAKISQQRPIKSLTVVEPLWVTPNRYNSSNPLDPHFYNPETFLVNGTEVNSSRMLTFISRSMPDILKPAYYFGGLPLTQMMKPYVDNWLRTRQSVSDLIYSFTVFVLSTDMNAVVTGGGADDFMKRLELFTLMMSNKGLFALNKDTETFDNISVPLSGLDHLQAQTQEHMAAVCGIPLVVFLGITPSGLNSSSEGEMRTFYDWISALQEMMFAPALKRVIDIIQLSLFGVIDQEIGFRFEPLWTIDADKIATIRKTDAETSVVLIDSGQISPHEGRVVLAAQEDSPYASLDLSTDPDPPIADPAEGGDMLAGLLGGASDHTHEASAP